MRRSRRRYRPHNCDVKQVVEIVTLIYQQHRSPPRENIQNIRPTRGASGVRERFLQAIHPPTPDPDSVARGLFSVG